MTDKLRIAIVQENPTVGDRSGNIEKIKQYRQKYAGKVDLIVFSECFQDGYPLGDLVTRTNFVRDGRKAREKLALDIEESGEGPAVLFGGVLEGSGRPYNAAFLIDIDGSIQVTLKHKLPNEQVYDEKRTFAEGPLPTPLRFRGWKLGVPICEDWWHGDVVRTLVEEGSEVLLIPNGSHFRVGKQDVRIKLARDYANQFVVGSVYVNQVGGQDELVFDGGSFVMDYRGHVIAQAAAFREASFILTLSRGENGVEIQHEMGCADLETYPTDLEAVYKAMVLGLRDYVRKCSKSRNPGIVLGMSGGLDSALSAAVAVDAIGKDNVLLVRLPSKLTSQASMDDAEEAAKLLGVRIETLSIANETAAFETTLAPFFASFGKTARDVTEENLQARARGMMLMAISNKIGHILLTTGNKSEMSVGYSTLYGDMCGGFSVLKDVYKTDVFRLAAWRNSNLPYGCMGPDGVVVPQQIIDKPPSAELSEGQTDEASLGSYEHLDAVLRNLTENMESPERAAKIAMESLRADAILKASHIEDSGERKAALAEAQNIFVGTEYAMKIARLVRIAQYKRRQAPPGVVVSARDYGLDYRFPIAGTYSL